MFASNTSQVSSDATYIEDVFSTYLFTATGSLGLSIPNGIDLAGKGGLVWEKCRNTDLGHSLADTVRGGFKYSESNSANAETTQSAGYEYVFGSSGYTNNRQYFIGRTYVSWTFRKQPKFFDVVTYTGDGTNPRSIAHNLGSTPGCIIIKRTDATANWVVRHRSMNPSSPWSYLALLNTTDARYSSNDQVPDSTTFVVGDNGARPNTNVNGATYVAYLFAHNAGGFGAAGTDNVISCGSYTTGGSGYTSTVNLGYEPQWILYKQVNDSGSGWHIIDNMRGWLGSSGSSAYLLADSSAAESSQGSPYITPTGFVDPGVVALNATIIYIAIRRGPMKTPTSGTSVFAPVTYSGTGGSDVTQTTGFPVDFTFNLPRNNAYEKNVFDRLRGWPKGLYTNLTMAEFNNTSYLAFDNNTGVVAKLGSGYPNVTNGSGWTYVTEAFRRAPGFMDVVCYTGTGSTRTVSHNLGVAPELMIVKTRNSADNDWAVYAAPLGATKHLRLNATIAEQTGSNRWGSTSPTASVFTVGDANETNWNTYNFVAYLFATCPGVSKVGSYTGSGTTKQIDCGFTGGARFVLIKRTDSTGDWYVWDTARGIVSGNDPYLLLNSTDAEVTNTDYIDAYSAGFEISSTAPAAINASGGTFVFFAIS